MENPYWLIRESGKAHGFATVASDAARNEQEALGVYSAMEPDSYDMMEFYGTLMEAVLVELHYDENNQPVVTEVASA